MSGLPSITFPAAALAQMLNGQLVGRPDVVLSNIAGIESAGPSDLTFIRSSRFAPKWASSRAGAALVTRGVEVAGHDPSARALIVVDSADLALIQLLNFVQRQMPRTRIPAGVHPTAIVDPTARVASTAAIGPMCVVGPGANIGEHAVLHARVSVGLGSKIGDRVELFPNVVIYDRCTIGPRTVIHAGAVIGADGFGYVPANAGGPGVAQGAGGAQGAGEHGHVKVPHLGTVEIGADVEIGANSCVDRAKLSATTIGDGTKIDNLVQIGHNCTVGRHVLICGQSGLAGSVSIGDGAVLAGQVGVTDNIKVGSGATLTAQTGAMTDIPAGETWSSMPARPHLQFFRQHTLVTRLPQLFKELKARSTAE
jgi:UDP-3-O-[3-hydroxymyristoyl] glucosamine N-acyltransferase